MSLQVYLWGIRLFTLLSFSAWLGIVVAVDPETGLMAEMLFFISCFAFLLGVMTLIITALYRRALGVGVIHHLGGAFRQSFLLTLFIMGIVFFQKERLLNWWDTLLLFAAVLLIEFSLRRIFSETVD